MQILISCVQAPVACRREDLYLRQAERSYSVLSAWCKALKFLIARGKAMFSAQKIDDLDAGQVSASHRLAPNSKIFDFECKI